MKKFIILIVLSVLVMGVYCAFDFIKTEKEKELKDNQNKTNEEVQNTVNDITRSANPVNTIDQSYNSVCIAYIDSVNYQIAINLMNNTDVPEVITDPSFTSSRETPKSVYLEIDTDKTVKKGTITYEHVVCNYENGKTSLTKRTN